MDNIFLLILIGFSIGTVGTLIGAGGGFILVPLLLLTHPSMPPEVVTAVSMMVVAVNALSGTVAYAHSKRVDYKAGLLFSLFTIPGSILGVFVVKYIPLQVFHILFGILLIVLASYLFIKGKAKPTGSDAAPKTGKNRQLTSLTDKTGTIYTYSYNRLHGIIISILVGFISPILGIGGGIIHVPAMVQWLHFPVYVATATSHFILAIMASVSVTVHLIDGHYNDPLIQRLILGLAVGVVIGAQCGAFISHKVKTHVIIKALAVCLAIVGIRILLT